MFFKKKKAKEKQTENVKAEPTPFLDDIMEAGLTDTAANVQNLDDSAQKGSQLEAVKAKTLEQATGESEEELKRQFELFKIQKILHRIDHTLLKQTATQADLKRLCLDAEHYGFFSVCVHPVNVGFVKRRLENSKVKVACVVGFPFGENLTAVKAFETKRAIRDGADEIDMVICISALKRGDIRYVKKDIRAVVKAAGKRKVKVIIETSLLSVKEMEQACLAIMHSGAAFVKTSTGYFGEGASVQIVTQLRNFVKDKLSIKASGGIRSADDATALLAAGADRLGTSNGVAIAEGLKIGSGY